ncbi:inositol monophosphatase 2 [Drosophila mojavensis]|uniref:inositol-phosphate phosphatase n=1 Tax=Drosophila mojavensis TaxID=7230 RepID=B4KUM3_DROMO|nr:inositol monophosphatase 2 [Drosophila mojavensis]EDW18251.2 uncharacterized protein Dmoj_GI12201 [Drosophila mojavensis]
MHSHASLASMSSDRKRRLVENISKTYPLNKFRSEIKGNLFKAAATPNIGSTRDQLPGDWGNSLGVLANLFQHEVASDSNTQSNGIDVQNTMNLGAEELESIDEVMKNAQELRRLGRKYLIRCKKPWEIKSGLYELGCQAWHVGTAILFLNQDHKAHMLLSYSMRRWTDQLLALLKRMHPELQIVERRGSIKVTSREPYSDQPSTVKKNERRAEKSKHNWAVADPRLPDYCLNMFRLAWQQLLRRGNGSTKCCSTASCEVKWTVDVDKCAKTSCALVNQAAELLNEANKEIRVFETKANNQDLVTVTDRQVEELLVSGLRREFPEHVYIGEEGTSDHATGRQLTNQPTWIIDPIDGTVNFVHGCPYNCISVALWLNRQPELAVCYCPTLQLKLTARRKCGCYLNGRQVRTSGQRELRRSLVLHEMHASNMGAQHKDTLWAMSVNLFCKAQTLRSTGSAVMDLCLVAMGAADAYVEFLPHCWDVAAGALLVREAGGAVMDPAGGELDIMSRRVLATATPELGCQMVQLLADSQIYHKRDDEP